MTIPWSKDTASARTCIAKSREEPLATLENVWIDLAVVLGKTSMPIHQVPQLGRGANVELDSSKPDEVRHPRQQPAGGQGHRHRQRQPHRGR
jgi:flagellar motor switch/type III secretory pathway protein FliN